MFLLSWLGYILVGKLLIYLGMKFPLPDKVEKIKFFKSLHECDLCLGVWIYTILALMLRMDILQGAGFPSYFYVPVITEGITGGIVSFLVHIFSIGWKAKYEVITL